MPERAARRYFSTDARTLAQRLIGAVLARDAGRGVILRARIVETEAYVGTHDQGSHARGGRRTARNEAMYARAGTAYVYFTYGMHHCMNVVCGEEGEPCAVLLRAAEPLEGAGAMLELRRRAGGVVRSERDLARGPGRLCAALGVDLALNGADLVLGPAMWVEARRGPAARVATSARIGLSCAEPWFSAPLRYFDPKSRCVSGSTRAKPAP